MSGPHGGRDRQDVGGFDQTQSIPGEEDLIRGELEQHLFVLGRRTEHQRLVKSGLGGVEVPFEGEPHRSVSVDPGLEAGSW